MTEVSVPVREDVLSFENLVSRTSKIKHQFSGPSGDFNLNRRQAAPLHSQVELFMSFFDPMALEAIHD